MIIIILRLKIKLMKNQARLVSFWPEIQFSLQILKYTDKTLESSWLGVSCLKYKKSLTC